MGSAETQFSDAADRIGYNCPMQHIRHLFLDMDGVLWRGDTPIPGLPDFFATLRRLDIQVMLLTNNATKTAAQYVGRLAGYGVQLAADHILGSAESTAAYLARNYPQGTRAYVIGEAGLRQALQAQGFMLAARPDAEHGLARDEVDLVVVGFDRRVCYGDLAQAMLYLNRGAVFVGTNPDVSFPSEAGPLPGAGALIALLEAASSRRALIVGKPGAIMFEEALRRLGAKPDNTAMVGDRLETDILGAQRAGLTTILVLSGVTSQAGLDSAEIRPDYVFADIHALAAALQAAHAPTPR